MIKIGITGGIGSGKSVVASLLEQIGIPVYIADTESKKLTVTSLVIREQLIKLFGTDIYTTTGLNKPLLASLIFTNPPLLEQVNAIIHPEVNRHFVDWVSQQHTELCAIESAILFESGFDHIVDITVLVYAPIEIRISRALERDSITRSEIERRINNQLPDEVKKDKCDYVIFNDNKQAILPQVIAFISQLTANCQQ